MISAMPLVSLVCPHYNRSQLVKETIDSVIRQTYPNWELIIVDDGSEEAELRALCRLRQFDERISVVSREGVLKGACVCRNQGLGRAKGDYVLFLDSDDLLAPWCLEKRVAAASAADGFDAWVFNGLRFEKEPGDQNQLWQDLMNVDGVLESFLVGRTLWSTSGPMWKKSVLLSKSLLWNESTAIWQDFDFHVRALISGCRFLLSADALPDYFIRAHQQARISDGEANHEFLAGKLKLFASLCSYIDTYSSVSGKRLRKRYLLTKFIMSAWRFETPVYNDFYKNLVELSRKLHVTGIVVESMLNYLSAPARRRSVLGNFFLRLLCYRSFAFHKVGATAKYRHALPPDQLLVVQRAWQEREQAFDPVDDPS